MFHNWKWPWVTFLENRIRIENSPASSGILILPPKPYRIGRRFPSPIFQASTISRRAPASHVLIEQLINLLHVIVSLNEYDS